MTIVLTLSARAVRQVADGPCSALGLGDRGEQVVDHERNGP